MALFAKNEKFEEQCFFTDFIADFSSQGSSRFYFNFVKSTLSPKSDTSKFFNKLTVPQGLDAFLNITPAQAASLVPYIRIYKVYYPDPKSPGIDYELTFENFITQDALESITNDRTGRGGGAGIKSFSWENRGESMATADKIFEAKLDLVFQDMNSLSENRPVFDVNGQNPQTFSWLDLVVPQEKFQDLDTNNRVWNDKYFRTKITVGWAIPDTISDNAVSFSEAEKEAIRRSGRTFFLNLVTHELSFSDVGQINLSITYQANTESIIGSPNADVLLFRNTESKPQRELDVLNEKLKEVRRDKRSINSDQCKDSFGDDRREELGDNITSREEELIEEIDLKKREVRATRYQTFMNRLYANQEILAVDVSTEVLEKYVEGEPVVGPIDATAYSLSSEEKNSVAKEAIDKTIRNYVKDRDDISELRDNLTESLRGDVESGKQRLLYVFLGAILDVALESINVNGEREVKTLCGMVKVRDPRQNKEILINLADIPVSLNMFTNWFFDVCISKELTEWRFKRFLNDVINQLFSSLVKAKCFDREDIGTGGDLDLKVEILDLPIASDGSDPIIPEIDTRVGDHVLAWNASDGTPRTGPQKPLQIEEIPDPTANLDYTNTNISSYLILYAKHTRPEEFQYPNPSGREDEDRKRKVYHLRVGRNRGLVKNINFSRVDQPYAKEARLLASVEENDRILAVRELYDADITLYGNTIWSPGSLFYVDLSSWFGARTKNENDDLDIAVKMGLQAYYRVISTSSFIENGKYEVQIRGKYEFSGVKKVDDEIKDGAPEKECPDVSKYDRLPQSTAGGRDVVVLASGNRLGGGSGGIR